MATYNLFGATIAQVLGNFKAGDYEPASVDFGGDDVVTEQMARAETDLEQAISPEVFRQMLFPELALLIRRSAPGQTVAQIPAHMLPVVAGQVSVWNGPPSSFQLQPRKRSDIGTSFGDAGLFLGAAQYGQDRFPSGNFKVTELPVDNFTVNLATGVITLLSPAPPMNQDDLLYASWQVDCTDAAYAVPSLGRLVATGAAAALGRKVYARMSDTWAHVQALQTEWDEALEGFQRQTKIVSELRLMRWWQPVEKTSDQTCGSQRKFRA